jgi:ribosomal protein S18 acetylase RimI-like enzyme
MLLIREATSDDAERLAFIARATGEILRRAYRPTAALEARDISYGPSTVLVAVLDGRVVGGMTCSQEVNSLHLRRIGVDPVYHRRGIAGALIAEAATRARADRLERLSLDTIRETGNVEIFRRLGFSVIFEESTDLFADSHGAAVTNVRMEKPIQGTG